MDDWERLRGRTALVTGGSSGLGRATALALAAAGPTRGALPRRHGHQLGDLVPRGPRRRRPAVVPPDALAPERVADIATWMVAAPADVVLNEITVTPLDEQAWP